MPVISVAPARSLDRSLSASRVLKPAEALAGPSLTSEGMNAPFSDTIGFFSGSWLGSWLKSNPICPRATNSSPAGVACKLSSSFCNSAARS